MNLHNLFYKSNLTTNDLIKVKYMHWATTSLGTQPIVSEEEVGQTRFPIFLKKVSYGWVAGKFKFIRIKR